MTLIQAALGKVECELIVRDVILANVLTGELYPADIGIWHGRVAWVDTPGQAAGRAHREVAGRGRIAVPGLIDAHMHVESTLVPPARFAEAVLPHGTTVAAPDPHEIANVCGVSGVRAFWQACQGLPVAFPMLVPTCVPSATGLETSGSTIEAKDVADMLTWPGVIGLGEVMDARAVVDGSPRMVGILGAGQTAGVPIEGHNPMLVGRELQAFVAAGILGDHTQAAPQRLVERLRLGQAVELQERYLGAEHIAALNQLPADAAVLLVTDDVAPDHLVTWGHLDHVVRRAIRLGMNPMAAVRAVTIKAARHLRLYDRGAIAPGKVADIVLLASSLADFVPETVIAGGELVVEDGRPLWSADSASLPEDARAVWSQTVKLPRQRPQDFHLLPPVTEGTVRCRLIWAHEGKTTTEEGIATLSVSQGSIGLDDVIVEHGGVTSAADLAYIAVCDRHGQTGERAIGLIANLGLRSGAIASTIAHDAHNLLVIGRSPEDMATAANAVIDSQGGLAVARGGQLLAHVALPLAGLMADEPGQCQPQGRALM